MILVYQHELENKNVFLFYFGVATL